VSGLRIGTPARIAFDRELAGFIGTTQITATAIASWELAHPHLADQLAAIFDWFANRREISSEELESFNPAMRALLKHLIVAVLTADPRSVRP
jgi:hypothetical protein